MKKIFSGILLISLASAVLISPSFIKIHVVCESQFGDCPAQVQNELNSFNGKSLSAARKKIKKILAKNYLVSNFSLQYKIPNILHIEILVKKPIFAFKSLSSGKTVLVDKDGTIIAETEKSALPTINISGELAAMGQNIGQTNFFALELSRGIYQMYQINEYNLQDDTLVVELPSQMRVIFPLEGDAQSLLGSLRLVYSKVTEDANLSKYSQIDLRYKNPVLK